MLFVLSTVLYCNKNDIKLHLIFSTIIFKMLNITQIKLKFQYSILTTTLQKANDNP